MSATPPAPVGLEARPYATFSARFAAALLDAVVQMGLGIGSSMAAGLPIRLLMSMGVLSLPGGPNVLDDTWLTMSFGSKLAIVVAFLVSSGLFYRPLCESSRLQATVGKRLMGIIVTDPAGARVTLPRAFARSILRGVATFLPLLPLSAVCVLVRKDRKAPHDLIAGTVNLQRKAPGKLGLPRILVIGVLPIIWVAVTMIAVVF